MLWRAERRNLSAPFAGGWRKDFGAKPVRPHENSIRVIRFGCDFVGNSVGKFEMSKWGLHYGPQKTLWALFLVMNLKGIIV